MSLQPVPPNGYVLSGSRRFEHSDPPVTRDDLNVLLGLGGDNYVTDSVITLMDTLLAYVALTEERLVEFMGIYTTIMISDCQKRKKMARAFALKYTQVLLTRMRHIVICYQPMRLHWGSIDVCIVGLTRRVVILDSILASGFWTSFGFVAEFDEEACEVYLKHEMFNDRVVHSGNPQRSMRIEAMLHSMGHHLVVAKDVIAFMHAYMCILESLYPGSVCVNEHVGLRKSRWEVIIVGYAQQQVGGDCGVYAMFHHEVLVTNQDPAALKNGGWAYNDRIYQHSVQSQKESPWLFTLPSVCQTFCRYAVSGPDVGTARGAFHNYMTGYNQYGFGMVELASKYLTPAILMRDVFCTHVRSNRLVPRERGIATDALISGGAEGDDRDYSCTVALICGLDTTTTEEAVEMRSLTEHIIYSYGLDTRINLTLLSVEDLEHNKEEGLGMWDGVDLLVVWDMDIMNDVFIDGASVPTTHSIINSYLGTEDSASYVCSVLYGFRRPGVSDFHFSQKTIRGTVDPWYAQFITSDMNSPFIRGVNETWAACSVDRFVGLDQETEERWTYKNSFGVPTVHKKYMSFGLL